MKAAKRSASKGSKRRGRPCKPDVARTDSGRISRAANANDPNEAPDKLAKEVRMRMHGLRKEDAALPEAGTVIGRLRLSGEISETQYDALDRYAKLADRYMTVMQVPDSLRKRGAGGAYDPDEETDASIRSAWADVTRSIHDAQRYCNGNLFAALQFLVLREEWHAHMVGDVRLAANALVRHYGLT